MSLVLFLSDPGRASSSFPNWSRPYYLSGVGHDMKVIVIIIDPTRWAKYWIAWNETIPHPSIRSEQWPPDLYSILKCVKRSVPRDDSCVIYAHIRAGYIHLSKFSAWWVLKLPACLLLLKLDHHTNDIRNNFLLLFLLSTGYR